MSRSEGGGRPLVGPHPPMKQINLSITTHCNRNCPMCCVRGAAPQHYPWEYFVEAAKYFHGIPVLHLTGGEPTTHPEFEMLAEELPKLFGCARFTLWTNGFGWPQYREVFRRFGLVHVSHYTPETYPGAADNTAVVRTMVLELGPRVRVEDNLRHVLMKPTGTKHCGRFRRGTVTYIGGLAWPCCVGPGPESARGLPLSDTWQTDLTQMVPPCDTCGFAL